MNWSLYHKGGPFCLKPFSWSAFLYFGLMLQTRKTQRMLQIFENLLNLNGKSLKFSSYYFLFFISFYISFQACLFKSNGKGILKLIFFKSFIINLKVDF